MSQDSYVRKLKRQAMRRGGMTFRQRVDEAMRTGKPVAQVRMKWDKEKHEDGPRLIAEKF